MHSLLLILTDIGDGACLLAVVIAGCIYLLWRKSGRAAAFLITSFLLSAVFISLLKIIALNCHIHFYHLDIISPSGHAANSAAVFWACAILMRSQLAPQRRLLPLILLTTLIALIAYSRVALNYHSTADVFIGLGTGAIALFIAYFFLLRGRSLAPFDAYVLALWAVGAAFTAHGTHMPAEEFIHSVAAHVKNHVSFCSNVFK